MDTMSARDGMCSTPSGVAPHKGLHEANPEALEAARAALLAHSPRILNTPRFVIYCLPPSLPLRMPEECSDETVREHT